jgi:hypothetical protein
VLGGDGLNLSANAAFITFFCRGSHAGIMDHGLGAPVILISGSGAFDMVATARA